MASKQKNQFAVLSILLLITIVVIIIFVIIPKYRPVNPDTIVEKIDFTTSEWIEHYLEKSVGIFGIDFYVNTAFTYNIRSNKMIVTYATQKSIEEVRDYYLTLPGAELTGRNDETSLNVTAVDNDQTLQVYNYYSPVSQVIELELTLNPIHAEKVISQLEKIYPEEELIQINEIGDIFINEVFGGYVRYRYDNLDEFAYPFTPIYSRAYLYNGTEEVFQSTVKALNEAYPDNAYNETQDTYYYKINQQIISIGYFVTDSNENLVSLGIQQGKLQE